MGGRGLGAEKGDSAVVGSKVGVGVEWRWAWRRDEVGLGLMVMV